MKKLPAAIKRIVAVVVVMAAAGGFAATRWLASRAADDGLGREPRIFRAPRGLDERRAPQPVAANPLPWPQPQPSRKHDFAGGDERARESAKRAARVAN